MDFSVLKDYQFVLLFMMGVLVILLIFYEIKRRYDSIDKHISNKAKETYKECTTEYKTLSSELGIETNYISIEKVVYFIKGFSKRK